MNNRSVTLAKYRNKCKEIFADFPPASVCVVFTHGSVVVFDQMQDNVEKKAKSILKESWLKSDKKQASILMLQDDVKIMGWTNQLVTLLLPNKHGRYQDMDKLYQIGSRKFAMDAKDLKIVHVLKNNVSQPHQTLGRSLSCMSSILC